MTLSATILWEINDIFAHVEIGTKTKEDRGWSRPNFRMNQEYTDGKSHHDKF